MRSGLRVQHCFCTNWLALQLWIQAERFWTDGVGEQACRCDARAHWPVRPLGSPAAPLRTARWRGQGCCVGALAASRCHSHRHQLAWRRACWLQDQEVEGASAVAAHVQGRRPAPPACGGAHLSAAADCETAAQRIAQRRAPRVNAEAGRTSSLDSSRPALCGRADDAGCGLHAATALAVGRAPSRVAREQAPPLTITGCRWGESAQ